MTLPKGWIPNVPSEAALPEYTGDPALAQVAGPGRAYGAQPDGKIPIMSLNADILGKISGPQNTGR